MLFERFRDPVIPLATFLKRVGIAFTAGLIIILFALSIGILGYHYFEGLPFLDSFVNAAMILSTMGSITPPATTGGKIFAACYALFSGLLFITIVGVIFSPFAHRLLHRWHLG